jgi:hypothetical protein
MQKALSFIPYSRSFPPPVVTTFIIETPATQSNRWKSEQTNKHKTRRGITYLHCVCARGTQPTIQAFCPFFLFSATHTICQSTQTWKNPMKKKRNNSRAAAAAEDAKGYYE